MSTHFFLLLEIAEVIYQIVPSGPGGSPAADGTRIESGSLRWSYKVPHDWLLGFSTAAASAQVERKKPSLIRAFCCAPFNAITCEMHASSRRIFFGAQKVDSLAEPVPHQPLAPLSKHHPSRFFNFFSSSPPAL
ncbi:hypothetical protein PCANC_02849 [Puccinia coronata f. sp. avenae]|uniref:Uncharacterized protein n=1 Tax=Puccinia coronata f. sp. avenae TaxID=200324 RepID=A0A2N5W426_9BASI|nr:hypothetical protein PCANC_14272 [Puccinia coronata f. sp. avenae]PLW42310.1 hypothetical protein PCASD_07726 [Puccinia coronata f. sp. avenae]PLW56999.1 hypothetical protein PCANC_02849 [Puccinia coronata f. sp. avenae]